MDFVVGLELEAAGCGGFKACMYTYNDIQLGGWRYIGRACNVLDSWHMPFVDMSFSGVPVLPLPSSFMPSSAFGV